tara:strand:- start:21284 stop:21397 length:114 start_codon:yes stop_codon:yes gene_type:complete
MFWIIHDFIKVNGMNRSMGLGIWRYRSKMTIPGEKYA